LALFALLWPDVAALAETTTVAVVTNINGLLTVRSSNGASHQVTSFQPVRNGDTLLTGLDSLSVLRLEGAGRVRLGAGTSAVVLATAPSLGLRLTSGLMCASADAPKLTISAGDFTLSAAAANSDFDVENGAGGIKVAVNQGRLTATKRGKTVGEMRAGSAAIVGKQGQLSSVPLAAVQGDFASMRCGEALASSQPNPAPPEQPGGGGGGGGAGGVLGALLALAAIAAGAGHGGGGGSHSPTITPTTSPLNTPPPGPLTVSDNNLSFSALGSANSKSFTASEADYAGPLNAQSSNPNVATVSPASGAGPSQAFSVTPVAAGTATIFVTDNHGGTASVNINVAPPGALSVSPSSLSFTALGPTNSQQFTASEANYSGPITAASSNSAVATVTPASGSGPSQTFTVTPISQGNATITVHDNRGGSQTVTVTVTPPGPLSVNPSNLSFSNTGAGNNQTFTASESNYTGPLNASSANTSVATVTPASGAGPNQTFIVTPVAPGNTTITVTDNHGGSASVTVTVTVPGPLSVNPTSLSFTAVGSGSSQTFAASESNYSGPLTAASLNAAVATVSPASGSGPNQTFTVTPQGPGSTSIVVTDDHGNSASVSINVTGSLSVNPTSLSFNDTGPGNSQIFTASEPNYVGPLTASSADTSVATVTPGTGTGPDQVFTVTPTGAGNTTITVSDNHGNSASVAITVTVPGALSVNPTSLNFTGLGSANRQTFVASEPNYSGALNAVSGNPAVATVSPASGSGPTRTFTVTPQGAGTTSIVVTDTRGNSASVSITVAPPGDLTVSPSSLSFDATGSSNAKTFNASESNYSGPITAVSNNTSIATVSPASGSGPSQDFTVTPRAAGTTTITVRDNHGGRQDVTINVAPRGSLTLNPTSLVFLHATSPPQSFTASETNYTGPFFTNGPSCTSVASVPPAGAGPNQTFTVAPIGPGQCTITVTDDHGGIQNELVTVYGELSVSPTTLTFTTVNQTLTVSVSEDFYNGPFSVTNNTCGGVATVGAPSSNGPNATINVTYVSNQSASSCSFDVTDNHNGKRTVTVNVPVAGAVTVTPTRLNLRVGGGSGSFTASQPNFAGPFTTNGCAGIATVFGSSPTFSVTPTAVGQCTITVTGAQGRTADVAVFVGGGTLTVNPPSLTLTPASTGTFTATDSAATATTTYTATSGDSAIATVLPATALGSGPKTFTVTAVAAGRTYIRVTDSLGGVAYVLVGVGMTPAFITRQPLIGAPVAGPQVPAPGPGTPQLNPQPQPPSAKLPRDGRVRDGSEPADNEADTVRPLTVSPRVLMTDTSGTTQVINATEIGYRGAVNATSSNSDIATVKSLSNAGFSHSFAVQGKAAGTTTIHIADENGQAVDVTVIVSAAAAPSNNGGVTPQPGPQPPQPSPQPQPQPPKPQPDPDKPKPNPPK
jgi:hypothetical protein